MGLALQPHLTNYFHEHFLQGGGPKITIKRFPYDGFKKTKNNSYSHFLKTIFNCLISFTTTLRDNKRTICPNKFTLLHRNINLQIFTMQSLLRKMATVRKIDPGASAEIKPLVSGVSFHFEKSGHIKTKT